MFPSPFSNRKKMCAVLTPPVVFTAWAAAALPLAAADYSFHLLVEDGDIVLGEPLRQPTAEGLNDNGTVVFSATIPCTNQTCSAVYKMSTTSLAAKIGGPGVALSGEALDQAHSALVDNADRVVFQCGRSGVFDGICSDTAILVKEGQRLGGVVVPDIESIAISGNGQTVFTAAWTPVFTRDMTTAQTALFNLSGLLLKSCESRSFPDFAPCIPGGAAGDSIEGRPVAAIAFPRISDNGTVAFHCSFANPATAVCSPSSILAAPGDVIGGYTLTRVNPPEGINGSIVFTGEYSGETRGIFTPSQALMDVGRTVAGYLLDRIAGAVAANSQGRLVFQSHFAEQPGQAQGWGVFTPEGVVVKDGDTLAGRAIASAIPVAINASGEVLLQVQFADSKQAVVLAQPDSCVAVLETRCGALNDAPAMRSRQLADPARALENSRR